MEKRDVVVVSAGRTPMGRFGGALKDMLVYDLGAVAISGVLKRSGLNGGQVDEVIVGHCRQAGNGPNPSKTASVRGGIPVTVHTLTINNACPSGMKSAIMATQTILLGDNETVVVAGMESMSTIPYLLKGVRWEGFRMGDKTLIDGWNDTVDPICNMLMGMTAEQLVEKYGIPREEQDQFSLESHLKAVQAQDKGWFDEEIIPVEVPSSKKGPLAVFTKDEPIRRDTSLEKLGKLPPVFKQKGSVTAGNSCSMSDGASAMVMMSRQKAQELGVKPLFSIVSYSYVGVENSLMGEGPGVAIPVALKKAGMSLKEIDLIEVNEAFAAQMLANERMLSWDRSRVNVHGGAIALGHPTGESGVRILVTLYYALKRRNLELGVAGICGGTGVACAIVIRKEN